MSFLRAAWRSFRLGYLAGRAGVHIVSTPAGLLRWFYGTPVELCLECNSIMYMRANGEIDIVGNPCPVHLAIREFRRRPLPEARSR